MGTPSTAAAVRGAWRRNEPLTFAPLHPLPLPEDLLLPHVRAVETITSAHVACNTARCNTFTLTGCFYVMSHGSDGGQEAKRRLVADVLRSLPLLQSLSPRSRKVFAWLHNIHLFFITTLTFFFFKAAILFSPLFKGTRKKKICVFQVACSLKATLC